MKKLTPTLIPKPRGPISGSEDVTETSCKPHMVKEVGTSCPEAIGLKSNLKLAPISAVLFPLSLSLVLDLSRSS